MKQFFNEHWWAFPGIALLVGYILLTNIFRGYDQQLEWDMKPPYHWVADSDNDGFGQKFYYIGSNGSTCATIYNYAGMWVVYGYGFNNNYDLKDEAEQVAYEYCY